MRVSRVIGHGSDVTAMSVPRSAQAIKKAAITGGKTDKFKLSLTYRQSVDC